MTTGVHVLVTASPGQRAASSPRGAAVLDDLGTGVPVSGPARRVVSLVPSLTESVAATRPEALVGATDWCTHPAGLAVTRVRGTKNPDIARIIDLAPDLVIANITAADGPEAFTTARTTLVSGRLLTWYGPSLRDAASVTV